MAGNAKLGFVGLGAMGYHMSANLIAAGTVSVWNRTSSVAEKHAKEHGTTAVTSFEEFAHHDIVSLCLPTSSISKKICNKLAPLMKRPNAIILDHTSGNPLETLALSKHVHDISNGKVRYIDAPISGGPAGAKAGTVTTMVGAKNCGDALLSRVLDAVAGRIVYLDVVGAGNAVKAINNLMNVSHLVFASECMYGLKLAGVNVGSALDAINHSSGRSLQTEVRLPTEVLTGEYKYGFDLELMLKDVRQAKEFLNVQFQSSGSGDDGVSKGVEKIPVNDLLLTEWSASLESLLETSLKRDLEGGGVLNEFGVPDYTRVVARYGLEEDIK